ncbi:aspartate-semialdehyde dehydrogenase [Tropheryma whipplei]|uniref:Aspartate-semialdehyde dehydrogenase n=1 Tax=Tropheryma whipplei (strain Twist) TaxID=203267 RepID=Q83FL4_TROWT|nr:aspartate-semialdehyde dehydrogenase [Tropheryma whipplei]AAO44804.1 aspartate-semialdehyde dehydrogenase [Tropheryma whipplei str. Twist]
MTSLAIIGATGQVGIILRSLIVERHFPVDSIRFFASYEGRTLDFYGKKVPVETLIDKDFSGIDIAIFSAGANVSRNFAPQFAKAGALVVDNSSAFRMDPGTPLVVSQVNPDQILQTKTGIVANPNCTTMISMPVLKPLHDVFSLKRVVFSTYQAVSGSGFAGINELITQTLHVAPKMSDLLYGGCDFPASKVYPNPIAFNAIPVAGSIAGDFETEEEKKLRDESRKILNIPDLLVSATCVRIPVFTGHSLAIHAEFENPISPGQAGQILSKADGVELCDVPNPISATGKNVTLVGRLRTDQSVPHNMGLVMFISGDNLRKGAALNALEIAEFALKSQ